MIHAFTQSNLENSLGRMKTKEIIAAVNNLRGKFQSLCSRCHELPSETNRLVEDLRSAWNERFQGVVKSMKDDAEAMTPLIEDLRGAFQTVCLTCAKVSDDDNPSNHGQTFVSLDSGSCQANSGQAKSTHTDDNVVLSRADWIGMHRSADVDDSRMFGTDPGARLMEEEEPEVAGKTDNGISALLPPEVEDRLRKEFSNFVSLDIIDKMLLSCIMSGMNIAEFAKMLWFPYSIVDPKTRRVKSITKQAAHARWANICRRFPVFMSVAVSSGRDSEKTLSKIRKMIEDPYADEKDDRFKNGKFSTAYLKTVQKEKEEEERRIKEERLKAKRREEAERRGMLRRKGGMMKMFPTDARDCLPGLF